MTSPLRRLALALAAASIVLGPLGLPAAAHSPRVAVPTVAKIEAAGGRLVAITRKDGRTHFEAVKAVKGRERATALELASLPGIVAVTVDRMAFVDAWPDSGSPNDPYWAAYQGDMGQINVGGAWPTTRGAGATVAVLDTGANLAHPDLAGLRVTGTYNAFDGTGNVADGHGHGTHVLGTVAAQTDNGIGVAGIAPDANILVVKVLSDAGSGPWSVIMNGIEWAIAHGATVITMSLGAGGTSEAFAPFAYATDDAYRAGVTVIAAAGNTGSNVMHFPACFAHVLSVASVGSSGARSGFSTWNSCNDVAAPGEGTLSTSNGGAYVQMSGTSMATPHVAGVIALIQSTVPGITPDTVENVLAATATDKGDPGRDDLYGHGIVNAGAALSSAAGGTPPPPAPTPRPTASPAPTPTPAPTPAPLPARVSRLAASPSTISYDANGYCPAAVKGTTITAITAPATATNGAATSVTLAYLKPGTTSPNSVSMTRGSTTTSGTTWTAILSTAANGLTTAGALSYWVSAANAAGATTRFPAGTATSRVTVAVCPNAAPAIGATWADRTVVATNPLGTGTMPPGAGTTVTLSASATDTDGVAGASVAISGAGLAAPVTVAMRLADGIWSATIDPTALRVPGGTLATKVVVTDARGLATTKAGPSITVLRADTAGSAAVTGIADASDNRPVVTITADDADATFGATTSTLSVSVRWSAVYTTAMGAAGVAPVIVTAAAYRGGRTWEAKLPATWLTTAVVRATITATPLARDPFLAVTTGETVTRDVAAMGAPTVMSAWASATTVYTDPLGTGNVAALAPMARSVSFTTRVADTDAITGVSVVYSGPGLSGTRSLPMTLSGNTWVATLTPSTDGITGTGKISWRIAATDERGLVGYGTTSTVTVTRADTPGRAAVEAIAPDAANATWITVTADDADAAFPTASTTSLVVKLRWSATYTLPTGARTTGGTATATYLGGRTWRAKVASATWLTAARSANFTLTPVATDPYGKVTTGATTRQVVRAYGS